MLIHCKKHPGDHWSCQLIIYSGTQLELSGWASWPCSNSHLLATMFFLSVCSDANTNVDKQVCTCIHERVGISFMISLFFGVVCVCAFMAVFPAGWAQTHRSKLMWLLFRLTYLRAHAHIHTHGACFTDTSSCVKCSLIVWRAEWGCPQAQGWDPKCSPSDGPALCSASFSILIALFPERDLVYLLGFFLFFCWCAISMSKQWHD